MTTISAKIIADSIGEHAPRLTTMQLRYPRAIHAEFMTHRVFSRNASSSRAIPVKRLIQDVINDPFVPLHWGKHQKGMQADLECDELLTFTDPGTNEQFSCLRDEAWLNLMNDAIRVAEAYDRAGYHKQIVNRLLEPWAHINVVCTATDWSNFLALRDHPDAEPHIQLLAKAMRKALDNSTPTMLKEDEWHLPYVDKIDGKPCQKDHATGATFMDDMTAVYVSVARCARVSYMTHDGRVPNRDEDIKLADRLLGSVPLHASPAEHQAKIARVVPYAAPSSGVMWPEGAMFGNLSQGWVQYRKMLPGERQ